MPCTQFLFPWLLENPIQAVPTDVKRALERMQSCSQNFPVLESIFFFLRKKLVCSFEGKTKNFERLSKEQYLEPGAVCQPMCNHVLYQRENQGYCNATVGSTLTLPLPHMQVPHIHQTTTPPKRFPDSWRAFLYLSFLIWKIKRQQGFFCMTKRLWR